MAACIDLDISIESLEVGVVADDASNHVPIGLL